MKIETGFDIARSPADAYAVLLDLERVTPCFPGAELLGHADDGAREARGHALQVEQHGVGVGRRSGDVEAGLDLHQRAPRT